jgi:hypothetical protein
MVTEVWDQVVLPVESGTTVSELKQEALRRALKRRDVSPSRYIVKFRGAQVHEAATLGRLGAGPNAPFIILPAAREPVR